MPISYTEGKVIELADNALCDDINMLYTKKLINYQGQTSDTKRYYSDVIAQALLGKYDYLESLGVGVQIRKTKSFNCNHDGCPNIERRLKRYGHIKFSEKLLAIAFYNSNQNFSFGKIFDYQIPLKEKRTDAHGEIDMVALRENSIKLMEMKISGSAYGETLLRALLEIFTYYKFLLNEKNKFIKDFSSIIDSNCQYKFQPVILTEKDSLSARQINTIEDYPHLMKLIDWINNDLELPFEFYTYKLENNNLALTPTNKIVLQGRIRIRRKHIP